MQTSRLARFVSVVMLIAAMLAALPLAASANDGQGGDYGNSANAHACRGGGWQSLYRMEDGTGFRNQGDCVSHGAQGGRLTDSPLLTVTLEGHDDYMMSFTIEGTGLEPTSPITHDIFYRDGTSELGVLFGGTSATGTYFQGWSPFCSDGMETIIFLATAADESPVSATVNVPC